MNNIMVCVTQQKSCDRLIKYGSEMQEASSQKGELHIIHIAHYDFKFMGQSEEGEALEYLYQKALEYNANLTVVRSNNIVQTLIELVEKNKIKTVVMGESRQTKNAENMVKAITKKLEEKDIVLIALP